LIWESSFYTSRFFNDYAGAQFPQCFGSPRRQSNAALTRKGLARHSYRKGHELPPHGLVVEGQTDHEELASALTRQGVSRPDALKLLKKMILPFPEYCPGTPSSSFRGASSDHYHEGIASNYRAFLYRTRSWSLAALLLLVNAYVCHDLFGIEYLRHMGSIEGAYVGISRYMLEHWRDYSWFPAWYAGIPAQNTYPPLLHWIVALAALLGRTSPAHAHHFVTALFYCLGPITLFALVLRLSGSARAAFFAGMVYSALSPSEWLMPAVGHATGQFHPERLLALVYYGEGPHVSSLTLIPLAILLLDLALDRKRVGYFVSAAFAFAAVALTNWIGAVGLALGVVAYILAKQIPGKLFTRDIGLVILIAVTAYCLAVPWIPPSTIQAVQINSRLVGADYTHTGAEMLRWAPAILATLLLLKLILRRAPPHFQFAVYFAFLTALVPLAVTWLHVAIVPQPERYHLEMELALALLLGLVLDAAIRRLPERAAALGTVLLMLALIWPLKSYRGYASYGLIKSIDITTTSEWRTAQWLNQHWSGGRVLLPGSTGYWLTAFSDTPEIWGGFDQGLLLPVYFIARHEIGSGDAAGAQAAEIAVLWFKALGVQAVGVTGPGSTEVYKDFRNPNEFEGVLQPLWRDGGDVLYSVGGSPSLAHVVAPSELVAKTPINGIDVAPLRPYVAALENPQYPAASFDWSSLHSAQIQTNLSPNSVVSIQISWSAGWHAQINGASVPVLKDGLGFIYLVPKVTGPVSISIYYDGGVEMKIAHAISITTLVLLLLACAWSWLGGRRHLIGHE
jgi:hypothetical protein